MNVTEDIAIRKTANSKIDEVDFDHLEFGRYTSDHMLVADFYNGEWHAPEILPFSKLELSPISLALHYGQTVFEGMKAFRMQDDQVNIFRPYKHLERFNKSLERMCMPNVSEEFFIQGLHSLINLDSQWVPYSEGSSLYIRPFIFASEERFGVKVSEEYKYIIITGPVGPYYAKPLKLKVECDFVRAAKGGTGYAKCGGNYGGAFYPTQLARQLGYDQVIWTDATEHKYIEESGTMNIMFVINNVLVTPQLSSSILDGVTRDSIITLAQDLGYVIEERPVSVEEVKTSLQNGTMQEAFGAGTAAVVAPIITINIEDADIDLPLWDEHSFMIKAKKKLSDIRHGLETDFHEWNYILK
ncbi:MAG: branched-chain amino acid aminotransferase [Chitinophagales bacterium]|nr:branched-chain amino acid aminotransferase [Chitinophagales bacterium]